MDSFKEHGQQEQEKESPFLIILDGGSTGSRLHVFEFVETSKSDTNNSDETDADVSTGSLECHRRGSARTDAPLSMFGRSHHEIAAGVAIDSTAVAEHFHSVFAYAATVIPAEWHDHTRVLYQATAGMRLLELEEQEAVYEAMHEGLMEQDDFAFKRALRRSDISTLSGELEGLYGAVAANYLRGIVNAQLHVNEKGESKDDDHHHHHGPIGALDMGGSSTQIVFMNEDAGDSGDDSSTQQFASHTLDAESDMQSCFAVYDEEQGTYTQSCEQPASSASPQQVLQGEDFFSTSYLSYGVDQFRERLWTTWVQEHEQQQAADAESCNSEVIVNPCSFVGYEQEWQGYTLVGTGDAEACADQVRLLIPHPHVKTHNDDVDDDDDSEQQRIVGGIEHPPVRGKFFAMSLYFFTLDSLRELSSLQPGAHAALNESWPTPSIQELVDALDGLCRRSWHDDLFHIQDDAHEYTRREVLPHRCLESVYMVTLLKDGFGFAPESRDITFTFLVDGNEVEWTLGMALVLQQEKQKSSQRKSGTTGRTASATAAAGSEFSMDKSNNTWKPRDVATTETDEAFDELEEPTRSKSVSSVQRHQQHETTPLLAASRS